MIIGQLYLGNNDGRLNSKLRMFVVNHNLRRRDLLDGKLWQSSFCCRQPVVIATTPATTRDLLCHRKRVGFRRRRNQSYRLVLLNFLHNLMSERRGAKDKAERNNVHYGRSGKSVRSIIIKLSPDCVRSSRSLGPRRIHSRPHA